MMKKLLKILLWTLAVVVGLMIVLLLLLNVIVKGITENAVPVLTKTTVALNRCDISLWKASVNLDSFVLGNPEGYTTPRAIAFNKVYIDGDETTLLQDVIVVDTVLVDGLSLTLEQGVNTNNIAQIIENLKSFTAAQSAEPQTDTAQAEKPASQKKIVIRKVIVQGTSVTIAVKGLGGISIPLPPLTLSNIGGDPEKDPQGVTVAEALETFLNAVLKEAANAGIALDNLAQSATEFSAKAAAELQKHGEKALQNASEVLLQSGDNANEALQSGADEAKKAVDGLSRGIKNLF